MKKLAVIFAVFVSNISFSQNDIIYDIITQNELIELKAEYVPDHNWKQIPLMDSLFRGNVKLIDIYETQPQLDIVTVSTHSLQPLRNENFLTYFSKFNFTKYLDTAKFIIKFDIRDVVVGSTQDPDDPNLILTTVGYQESILIKNKITNTAELLIDVFYLEQSSYIRGVNVFTSDVLQNY